MCGINGVFAFGDAAASPTRRELLATRDYMTPRGPDGAGEWWSPDARVGLGHRRLSIIDLSDRAAQPMASADGTYIITFNGEIYNYQDLKRDLEVNGAVFRTSSDTEVLLHLYARDGASMVPKLRGMFAFAIWDTVKRELFLARDPYGIKPLYVSTVGGVFRFASQVKALLAGGQVPTTPDPAGIVGFHLWGSVPEPHTLYASISALPAGSTLLVDRAGPQAPRNYSTIAAMFAGAQHAREETPAAFSTRAREALLDSVRAHLLADVEVGVFLSAGIDSGAVLGLMRDAGQGKIRAITLAFEEFRGKHDDEAPLAAEVARMYGAEHVVRFVTAAEFEADVPQILAAMDQPSIDGVNTYFVAKAAREAGLKVALSGVGGDELFGGYPSFVDIPRWVSWMRVPGAIPGLGKALRAIVSLSGLAHDRPKAASMVEYGGTLEGAYMLRRALFTPAEIFGLLPGDVVREGLKSLATMKTLSGLLAPRAPTTASAIACLESAMYLRNQLLRDTDWAGMAHGLEIRTPLVDARLTTTLGPNAPAAGHSKAPLANAPSVALPAGVRLRKKSGFSVPNAAWQSEGVYSPSSSRGAASRRWAAKVFAAAG